MGLFVGSFLNVVVYRVPLGLSVSHPRSFCPTCYRQLAWWENIPVASWVALRGRCRTCHEAISIRYPLVELVTGTSFALTTWAWNGTLVAAGYCVLVASFIAVGLIEYGGRRAPLSVAAIGTGLGQAAIVVGGLRQHLGHVAVGSLIGTIVAAAALGVLQHRDPLGSDPRGHGRSGLLLLGCWAGGLGLAAAAVGASAWMLVYSIGLERMWAVDRRATTAGGSSEPLLPSFHPVATTPLVTAIAAAMAVSLLAGG
jgi:leader peptidase (prepilin peptidase)/N-methyltransferase